MKSPTHFSQKQRPLAALFAIADRLCRWEKELACHLPLTLAPYFRVLKCEKETLVIGAHSGAAAARLRQEIPSLMEKLNASRQDLSLGRQQLSVIQIIVQMPPPMKAPLKQKKGLPAVARQTFQQIEAQLPKGPVKTALRTLLAHAEQHEASGGAAASG